MRRHILTFLFALLATKPLWCEDGSEPASKPKHDSASISKSTHDEDRFEWRNAILQSFFSVSLANAYRVATQPDTRQTIKGPFWQSYADSVQALHGWNDGDGFFTSYVLHPMQGSATGYIERQNDPRYRDVEFGTSQRYWISCMRSLAFSTASSVVWSATPLGEAGIGNVELHNKPGLVDLVGTQTMGLGWMIGEDAIDRFVIRPIEWRVHNPVIRALVRSTLNPTRSYANILALRKPWHRDDRPGVLLAMPSESEFAERSESEPKFRAKEWPEKATFELMASPMVVRYLGRAGSTCLGTAGEGSFAVSRSFDVAFEIDGCELYGLGQDVSGDTLTYVTGPRWRLQTGTKWTPFFELLAGGVKISHVTYHPEKQRDLGQQAQQQGTIPPDWHEYHSTIDTNGATIIGQAGVNYRVSDLISWRVGSIGYQRSWMLDRLDGLSYDRGLRFSTGIAITMGPAPR